VTVSHIDVPASLELLRSGEFSVVGRIVEASNATLLCEIAYHGREAHCVYKPVRGERPLWDFPDGTLAGREVAAYEVSAFTGWDLVPPTVLREGEFGPGMVQLWVDGDEDVDLVAFVRSEASALRRLAVFDAIVNNSDRKGGHLIPMAAGPTEDTELASRHVYGVDHGVTFNVDDKLRTILWMWAGERLTDDALGVLEKVRGGLDGDLGHRLCAHLTPDEVAQTIRRVDDMLRTERHPLPSGDWPAYPYPPF